MSLILYAYLNTVSHNVIGNTTPNSLLQITYLAKHRKNTYEPRHEISNNVKCATNKASDQPAHIRSLIRAFASRLSIL